MKTKIITGKTLEQYNKKYRNRKYKLLSFTKKEVKDFDKFNKSCEPNFLLKGRKWWLIKDTYYEIPKAPRITWFRNLNAGVQAGVCLLAGGAIASAVAVPLVILNQNKTVEPSITITGADFDKKASHIELNKESTIKLKEQSGKTIQGIEYVKVADKTLAKSEYSYDESTKIVTIKAEAMTSTKIEIKVKNGDEPVTKATKAQFVAKANEWVKGTNGFLNSDTIYDSKDLTATYNDRSVVITDFKYSGVSQTRKLEFKTGSYYFTAASIKYSGDELSLLIKDETKPGVTYTVSNKSIRYEDGNAAPLEFSILEINEYGYVTRYKIGTDDVTVNYPAVGPHDPVVPTKTITVNSTSFVDTLSDKGVTVTEKPTTITNSTLNYKYVNTGSKKVFNVSILKDSTIMKTFDEQEFSQTGPRAPEGISFDLSGIWDDLSDGDTIEVTADYVEEKTATIDYEDLQGQLLMEKGLNITIAGTSTSEISQSASDITIEYTNLDGADKKFNLGVYGADGTLLEELGEQTFTATNDPIEMTFTEWGQVTTGDELSVKLVEEEESTATPNYGRLQTSLNNKGVVATIDIDTSTTMISESESDITIKYSGELSDSITIHIAIYDEDDTLIQDVGDVTFKTNHEDITFTFTAWEQITSGDQVYIDFSEKERFISAADGLVIFNTDSFLNSTSKYTKDQVSSFKVNGVAQTITELEYTGSAEEFDRRLDIKSQEIPDGTMVASILYGGTMTADYLADTSEGATYTLSDEEISYEYNGTAETKYKAFTINKYGYVTYLVDAAGASFEVTYTDEPTTKKSVSVSYNQVDFAALGLEARNKGGTLEEGGSVSFDIYNDDGTEGDPFELYVEDGEGNELFRKDSLAIPEQGKSEPFTINSDDIEGWEALEAESVIYVSVESPKKEIELTLSYDTLNANLESKGYTTRINPNESSEVITSESEGYTSFVYYNTGNNETANLALYKEDGTFLQNLGEFQFDGGSSDPHDADFAFDKFDEVEDGDKIYIDFYEEEPEVTAIHPDCGTDLTKHGNDSFSVKILDQNNKNVSSSCAPSYDEEKLTVNYDEDNNQFNVTVAGDIDIDNDTYLNFVYDNKEEIETDIHITFEARHLYVQTDSLNKVLTSNGLCIDWATDEIVEKNTVEITINYYPEEEEGSTVTLHLCAKDNSGKEIEDLGNYTFDAEGGEISFEFSKFAKTSHGQNIYICVK